MLVLVVWLCASRAAAQSFPEVADSAEGFPGEGWFVETKLEVGYAKPYPLREIHAGWVRWKPPGSRGWSALVTVEALRTQWVRDGRVQAGLQRCGGGLSLVGLWLGRRVEVGGLGTDTGTPGAGPCAGRRGGGVWERGGPFVRPAPRGTASRRSSRGLGPSGDWVCSGGANPMRRARIGREDSSSDPEVLCDLGSGSAKKTPPSPWPLHGGPGSTGLPRSSTGCVPGASASP